MASSLEQAVATIVEAGAPAAPPSSREAAAALLAQVREDEEKKRERERERERERRSGVCIWPPSPSPVVDLTPSPLNLNLFNPNFFSKKTAQVRRPAPGSSRGRGARLPAQTPGGPAFRIDLADARRRLPLGRV